MIHLSTRQQVISALSQLVGLPLAVARRAADMRVFHFGAMRAVERGSVGEFALHIHCPWRVEGPDGIVTGRSDLWEPAEESDPDRSWDYEKSPNLQDVRIDAWLSGGASPVVVAVDADDFGGAAILFDHGSMIRLFPAGTRGEDWRLFAPGTDAEHFVLTGGKVEIE